MLLKKKKAKKKKAKKTGLHVKYRCATPEQYEKWRKVARLIPPPVTSWFCTDCTPEYQKGMMRQRKCARSYIKFETSREEGYVGFVPSLRKKVVEVTK